MVDSSFCSQSAMRAQTPALPVLINPLMESLGYSLTCMLLENPLILGVSCSLFCVSTFVDRCSPSGIMSALPAYTKELLFSAAVCDIIWQYFCSL